MECQREKSKSKSREVDKRAQENREAERRRDQERREAERRVAEAVERTRRAAEQNANQWIRDMERKLAAERRMSEERSAVAERRRAEERKAAERREQERVEAERRERERIQAQRKEQERNERIEAERRREEHRNEIKRQREQQRAEEDRKRMTRQAEYSRRETEATRRVEALRREQEDRRVRDRTDEQRKQREQEAEAVATRQERNEREKREFSAREREKIQRESQLKTEKEGLSEGEKTRRLPLSHHLKSQLPTPSVEHRYHEALNREQRWQEISELMKKMNVKEGKKKRISETTEEIEKGRDVLSEGSDSSHDKTAILCNDDPTLAGNQPFPDLVPDAVLGTQLERPVSEAQRRSTRQMTEKTKETATEKYGAFTSSGQTKKKKTTIKEKLSAPLSFFTKRKEPTQPSQASSEASQSTGDWLHDLPAEEGSPFEKLRKKFPKPLISFQEEAGPPSKKVDTRKSDRYAPTVVDQSATHEEVDQRAEGPTETEVEWETPISTVFAEANAVLLDDLPQYSSPALQTDYYEAEEQQISAWNLETGQAEQDVRSPDPSEISPDPSEISLDKEDRLYSISSLQEERIRSLSPLDLSTAPCFQEEEESELRGSIEGNIPAVRTEEVDSARPDWRNHVTEEEYLSAFYEEAEENRKEDSETYEALAVRSKQGKHPAVIYRMEDECYRMCYARQNKDGTTTFHCVSCKAMGKIVSGKVRDGFFEKNPETLPHVCTPVQFHEEMIDRKFYETTQQLRSTEKPDFPSVAFMKTLASTTNDDRFSAEDCLKFGDAIKDYSNRKSALVRARTANDAWTTTMKNIEEKYKKSLLRVASTAENPPFVQEHDENLLICYTSEMFAQKNKGKTPWAAIIADGIHSVRPVELGDNGQLYTIHGVTENGTSAPLLFAFTNSKTTMSYAKLFRLVRQELENGGTDVTNLPIVTDFEKAAMKAVSIVFGEHNVHGCSFHYAMAFNRRARALETLAKKYPAIEKWLSRLRALTYFPDNDNLLEISEVLNIPINTKHEGYQECCDFIKYFRNTWLEKPFRGKWQKFLQKSNRTSNTAENYHRSSKQAVGPTPPLGETLEYLRNLQATKYFKLRRDQPTVYQDLEDRKEEISQKMDEFYNLIKSNYVDKKACLKYLDTMSDYISKKCI